LETVCSQTQISCNQTDSSIKIYSRLGRARRGEAWQGGAWQGYLNIIKEVQMKYSRCKTESFDFSVEDIENLVNQGDNKDEDGYFRATSEISGAYSDYVRQILRGQQDTTSGIGEDVLRSQNETIMYSFREYLVIS
jgi:hypothetical protein